MDSIVIENALPDIPRYFTALAEWGACLVFLFALRRKCSGWKLAGISAAALILQTIFLTLTDDVPISLWLPCMAAAVLLMMAFLFACCRVNWRDTVYYGLQAFMLAEFTASFEWQMFCFLFYNQPKLWFQILVMLLFYVTIYLFYWRVLVRHQTTDQVLDAQNRDIYQALLITVAVFAISNVSYYTQKTPFSSMRGESIVTVRTIVDFCGVVLLHTHYMQRLEMRMQKELNMMKTLVQNQYIQYQQSKESIDLLNYKYHDLKHQIAVLRAEEDPEKRNAFLNRMEEEIHRYEAQNKTGNPVLDTILTSKTMTCQSLGISLNCVAEGTLLDFMDVMDICSIVGNALDNAIECEKNIPEQEKRLIHVAIFSQKNFLIMRFENYFEGGLELEDGLPVTTKEKDREFHGYGIKSIRYTVQKYEGAVSIDTRENWFELKILLPLAVGS